MTVIQGPFSRPSIVGFRLFAICYFALDKKQSDTPTLSHCLSSTFSLSISLSLSLTHFLPEKRAVGRGGPFRVQKGKKRAKRAKIEKRCKHGPSLEPKTGRLLEYRFTHWAICGSGSPFLILLGKFIFVHFLKSRLLTFTNLLTNVNQKVDQLTWYCRSSPGVEVDLTLYQVKLNS